MTEITPNATGPDERRPLPPGTRIGDAFLVLKPGRAGAAGLAYEGLRLSDQSAVTIIELFPAGISIRDEDGKVIPIRGWEAELEGAQKRAIARAAKLEGLSDSAVQGPGVALEALGTSYWARSKDPDPTLEGWIRDLLRRPTAIDIGGIFGDLAAGLLALHAAGLAHGALEGAAVHVSGDARARLVDAMLSDASADSARRTDMIVLAELLYNVVTGREAPPRLRDRSLDMRFSAAHIAAGDYPDALLAAIDDALELGEGKEPVDAGAWLAGFVVLSSTLRGGNSDTGDTRGILAGREAVASRLSEPAPVASPRSPAPVAVEPRTGSGEVTPRKRSALVLPLVALGLLGAGGGLVALLLSQPPSTPGVQPQSQLGTAAPSPDNEAPVSEEPIVPQPAQGAPPDREIALIEPPAQAPPEQELPVQEPPVQETAIQEQPAQASTAEDLPDSAPEPGIAVADVPASPVPTPPSEAASPELLPAPVAEAETPEVPAAEAPEPPAAVAEPEPSASAVLPPPPPEPAVEPPRPTIESEISSATNREALISLLARGADQAAVEARLAALGYVTITSGGERVYRRPGEAEPWQDCEIACPTLVLVPNGTVEMTVAIGESVRSLVFEIPNPLAIGRFEVTKDQFGAFVGETGWEAGPGCHARQPNWSLDPTLSWEDPGFAQTGDDPAVCVSREDATAYLEWLSARTGARYRLPSDAEWHYLAVAERWPVSTDGSDLCRIGNGADRASLAENPGWEVAACDDTFASTAPVGRFAAGPWGLHDLNGNVWEWVDTCAPEPRADAPFPPVSCPAGAPRLLRGGSWADAPELRRLDSRVISAPGIRDRVAGFRVVREP